VTVVIREWHQDSGSSREKNMAVRPPAPSVSALRARYEHRVERLTALRHVRSELVSLAGLGLFTGQVLILANRASVLGPAANGRIFKIVAAISVVAVAVLSPTVLVQAVLSGFGIS
jgi:hypothetical protein